MSKTTTLLEVICKDGKPDFVLAEMYATIYGTQLAMWGVPLEYIQTLMHNELLEALLLKEVTVAKNGSIVVVRKPEDDKVLTAYKRYIEME